MGAHLRRRPARYSLSVVQAAARPQRPASGSYNEIPQNVCRGITERLLMDSQNSRQRRVEACANGGCPQGLWLAAVLGPPAGGCAGVTKSVGREGVDESGGVDNGAVADDTPVGPEGEEVGLQGVDGLSRCLHREMRPKDGNDIVAVLTNGKWF